MVVLALNLAGRSAGADGGSRVALAAALSVLLRSRATGRGRGRNSGEGGLGWGRASSAAGTRTVPDLGSDGRV